MEQESKFIAIRADPETYYRIKTIMLSMKLNKTEAVKFCINLDYHIKICPKRFNEGRYCQNCGLNIHKFKEVLQCKH